MKIKIKTAFAFLFLSALIAGSPSCIAQSIFDRDSVAAGNRVMYIVPSKYSYKVSTDKEFLRSQQNSTSLLNDEAFLEGDFINRRDLSREYIKAITLKRAKELIRNFKMDLSLRVNNSGSVEAVVFDVPKSSGVTPEDLITINDVIKSSAQIKLPASIKHAHKLAPYRYPFDFLMMAAYRTDFEAEPLHTDWVNNDINLLTQLSGIDKHDPQKLVDFFARITNYSPRDTLGFGWTHVNTAKGAGYISVRLDYYIYNGKIVSYSLYSEIASRADLANKYDSLLHVVMPLDSGRSVYYKFRDDRILAPVADFAGSGYKKAIPLQMLRYMSPSSGTLYGYAGGLPVSTTQNRAMFNEIIKRLSPDQIVTLMYSINPASRLSAIEYYYRHPERFKNRPAIERWIKKVYAQNGTVESISGCIIYNDTPEKLVTSYLKWQGPPVN